MKRPFFRAILFFSAAAIAISIGCGKSKNSSISANISYGFSESVPVVSYPAHVPLPANGISVSFPGYPVNTNYQQHLSDNSTDTGFVNSFTLNALTLQIAGAPNFDFLDSVGVYLQADSLKDILVAYKVGIPKGLSQINLDLVHGLDVRQYFYKDVMSFRVHGNIDSLPATGASINLNATFALSAKPLN